MIKRWIGILTPDLHIELGNINRVRGFYQFSFCDLGDKVLTEHFLKASKLIEMHSVHGGLRFDAEHLLDCQLRQAHHDRQF